MDSAAYTASCWRDSARARSALSATIVYLHGFNSVDSRLGGIWRLSYRNSQISAYRDRAGRGNRKQ